MGGFEMITRSTGMTTGTGYLAGSGYEGKTKELDDTVKTIAERLSVLFDGRDVVMRFNNNRESGGAFIKDEKWSDGIGIGASLQSSKFHAMTFDEKKALPHDEFAALMRENDIILYHVVLDKCLLKPGLSTEGHQKSIDEAFVFLSDCIEPEAAQKYLENIITA
jgi:hypothetical protein